MHHAENGAGRSILLTKASRTWYLFARRQTVSPRLHAAHGVVNHDRTVQYAHRKRSTSMVKSTCPGVSMILSAWLKAAVHTGPSKAHRRGRNGDPTLLLLRHPVGAAAHRVLPSLWLILCKTGCAWWWWFCWHPDIRGDRCRCDSVRGWSGHDASLVILTVSQRRNEPPFI